MIQESPLLTTNITAQLRERVYQLRTKEFVRFAPERALAENLGVSRETIRKAARVLIHEGLLVQKQGSGTYVVPELGIKQVKVLKAADLKSDDPFYMIFMVEITHHLAHYSVPLLGVSVANLPDGPIDDPLVIIGYLQPERYEAISRIFPRRLAVQCHPMYSDITQVDTDYYRVGYDAVAELVKSQHTRLLHLAGPEDYPASAARRRGFRDAVRDFGVEGDAVDGKMNWNSGRDIAEEVFEGFIRPGRVSAVVAANDWMAHGFMSRIRELGVRIPEDLSIIGCDDIQLWGETSPGVTTFRTNFPLIISEVYEELNRMCQSDRCVARKILLPAHIIRRDSVAVLIS